LDAELAFKFGTGKSDFGAGTENGRFRSELRAASSLRSGGLIQTDPYIGIPDVPGSSPKENLRASQSNI